jgi:hypothetical protein
LSVVHHPFKTRSSKGATKGEKEEDEDEEETGGVPAFDGPVLAPPNNKRN